MAVAGSLVGRKGLVGVRKMRVLRKTAAGARHAALGIEDDAVRRVAELFFQCRHKTKRDAGRIAAGIGDNVNARNALAVDFRQAIECLFVKCRMLERQAIPLGIIGLLGQAEIRTEVD